MNKTYNTLIHMYVSSTFLRKFHTFKSSPKIPPNNNNNNKEWEKNNKSFITVCACVHELCWWCCYCCAYYIAFFAVVFHFMSKYRLECKKICFSDRFFACGYVRVLLQFYILLLFCVICRGKLTNYAPIHMRKTDQKNIISFTSQR